MLRQFGRVQIVLPAKNQVIRRKDSSSIWPVIGTGLFEDVINDFGGHLAVTKKMLLLHVRVLEEVRQHFNERFLKLVRARCWLVLAYSLTEMVKEFAATTFGSHSPITS
ncbi:hypothetical protein AQ860_11345 [Burkholderia pseudomallei]|nr:hypothetical protein AQ760_17555 [Burkholderia pseudomallei]OMZ16422.1 hypothetical protein AQ859_13085 [Burkholderia pseudomallei]OMZ37311.1 hypothetical protein AQ860_11345 [Burkholderia pseudomallei]